jgi:hypothetical protein
MSRPEPNRPPEQPATTAALGRTDLDTRQDSSLRDSGVAGEASRAPHTEVVAVDGGAAMLVVHRGPNAGSQFLLDRDISRAGRHPDSDIVLDDVTVSRCHVEFHRDRSGQVVLTDVGSLNGTYLNREPADSAVLTHGDEVQIGKFRLTFLTHPT